MPLPLPNSEWPPPMFERSHAEMAAWSAWWGGDPDELSEYYGGAVDGVKKHSWAGSKGGLVGRVQRYFWGQRPSGREQRTKLHLPLAAEIAQVSADLLFGAPPTLTVADADSAGKATQARLEDLLGEDSHVALHDAAEACSALGHVYLRVGWDKDVDPTGPLISVVDADCAYPQFSNGELVEVTFLSEWEDDTGAIWRHLEHHEKGAILHALHLGDSRSLGPRANIGDHPSTEHLLDLLDDDGVVDEDGIVVIETGIDMLDVVGIPNARSRTLRRRPGGERHVGRADIAGMESLLDALDDTYSSWMRDIRHGRSRIHIPQHYMKSMGPGKGAVADLDSEVYVAMNAMVGSDGQLQVAAQQFLIRWQEHKETGTELISRITSGAGFSPQTFGIAEVSALTAAESWNRQIRTQHTRAAKARRWRKGLRQLAPIVIAVDLVHFKGGGDPEKARGVEVNFRESVSESMQARAQTVALMAGAEAASLETMVGYLHQDWDKTQRDEEVKLILDQRALAAPADPFAFNGPGDGEEPAGGPTPSRPPAPRGGDEEDEEAA